MNADIAKKFVPILQAIADGKTIQKRSVLESGLRNIVWRDVSENVYEIVFGYRANPDEFRVKPEVKKQSYRISMIKYASGKIGIGVSQSEAEENALVEMKEFVRWLTDRIEYELPEGEA